MEQVISNLFLSCTYELDSQLQKIRVWKFQFNWYSVISKGLSDVQLAFGNLCLVLHFEKQAMSHPAPGYTVVLSVSFKYKEL